jgi:nucleotide-binding universal stress UspA family protein
MTPAAPEPVVYLVAVDASAAGMHVLDVACGLAMGLGGNAELHVMHVVAEPAVVPDSGSDVTAVPQYLREAQQRVERSTAHAAERFNGWIAGHLATGEPWREIVQMASDIGVDLIIVGTSGRTGLARFALGSVAEQVVRHAGCPVLVVRPRDHQANASVRIEPPCEECLAIRKQTRRATLWCERHGVEHLLGRTAASFRP